jgi:uncharacterized protein (TIGR03382 family)
MSILRTLLVALALAALAAPAAQARPQQVPDMHASVALAAAAKSQREQDLRWLNARGEAHPRSPGHPSEVGASSVARAQLAEPVSGDAGGDDGPGSTSIGLGIAGGLLVLGGLAALAGRRRTQRLRVAA